MPRKTVKTPLSSTSSSNGRCLGLVPMLALAIAVMTALWMAQSTGAPSSSLSSSLASSRTLSHGSYNVTCEKPASAVDARDARAKRKGVRSPPAADGAPIIVNGCSPVHNGCARVVHDHFVTAAECRVLIELIEGSMTLSGGGSGGPSVLDLHSGAISRGSAFVDIYRLWDENGGIRSSAHAPSHAAITLYRSIARRIAARIRDEFGIDENRLWLTSPAFFSRIRGDHHAPAITTHDEYWHDHIDRLQYGSFAYTALLYLNDYQTDFTGGRFVFTDPSPNTNTNTNNVNGHSDYVEPRAGRLNLFTSGAENTHRVDKVVNGTRYALTIAFTCDKQAAITEWMPRLTDDAFTT